MPKYGGKQNLNFLSIHEVGQKHRAKCGTDPGNLVRLIVGVFNGPFFFALNLHNVVLRN